VKKIGVFITFVIIIFIAYNMVFAADMIYRLMHNDHDALVIGKVKEVSGDKLTIDVEKQVISSKNLNEGSPKQQIPLDGEVTIKDIKGYSLFSIEGSLEKEPQKDDIVLASLNKEVFSFTIANGIFKVDSLDFKTLNVLYPQNASKYNKMEAFAIKTFVNSDGNETEFGFDSSTGELYLNGEVVFDASKGTEETIDENISGKSNTETNEIKVKSKFIKEKNNNQLFILMLVLILLMSIKMAVGYKRSQKK